MAREWTPKTELGKKVLSGEIKSIDEIFERGLKIKEPQIVEYLLPALRYEIIHIGGSPGKGGGIRRTPTRRTARMHRSGRRYKISAMVAVGCEGYIGIGKSESIEHSLAIEKATQASKLNVIPVKRSCGSWECACGSAHSIPNIVEGRSGSSRLVLIPAPKGIGLCVGEEGKKIFRLAGIKDVWSKSFGGTRTRVNYILAIFDAFKNLNKMRDSFDKKETKEEPEGTAEKTEEMVKTAEEAADETLEG
jgi:small subunit ribosomal protein S5